MKKTSLLLLFLALAALGARTQVLPLDWHNGGGNPQRNGLVDAPGPAADSVLWQATTQRLIGFPGYIEGDKFATMRFLNTTNAPVECRDLNTGALLWSQDVTGGTGRSLPVGLRNGKVYVMRLTESLEDSLFALDAATGVRLWASPKRISTYITNSANFAPNGDLFIEAWSWATTSGKMCRINHLNGQLIWECSFLPPVVGASELSIYGDTGYLVENIGGIIHLTAIDINTGQRKYSHKVNDTNPGGAVPQVPISIGQDGTIFFQKQEDNISAFKDDGSQLSLLWETPISGNAPFSFMCTGPDGTLYAPSDGRVIRLDPATGEIMNSSAVICQNPQLFQMRASAASNGIIYVTNGENNLYALTQDLQLLWSDFIPNVNTSGACISADGLVAVSGSNLLRVYTPGNITGTAEATGQLVNLFPNPTTGTLSFTTDPALAGKRYAVYGLSGNLVAAGIVQAPATTLDLGAATPGLYLLQVESMGRALKIVRR